MGRIFSTVYRIILMVASLSAMVLSILSATSCSFLTYDYQTKIGTTIRFIITTESVHHNDDTTINAQDSDIDRILQSGDNVGSELTPSPSFVSRDVQTFHPSSVAALASSFRPSFNNSTTLDNNDKSIARSAGLFCTADDDSFFKAWKGTFNDSKGNQDSDNDESEALARNGVISAITFGALSALILSLECLLGWKICCEKWIISLLSITACISQGITFLFFNSDRYCDANIIHEILKKEPCIVGEGATMAIVSMILYGVIVILICRAPDDDPYNLLFVCRKQYQPATKNADNPLTVVEQSINGGAEESTNMTMSETNHSAIPTWLSDQKRYVKEIC